MISYSTLTILLILVAALSTPAAAVNRKLQKRKGRKLSKSGKNSKCTKVAKASCIHIVMDDLQGKSPQKNQVDTAVKLKSNLELARRVFGTTWLSRGKIKEPANSSDDYFYSITCDVIDGSSSGDPLVFIDVKSAICHLDICIGSTYTYTYTDDDITIPDCVYLKGFITGIAGVNDGKAVLERTQDEGLSNVDDFNAMIVSGTGRFAGSIGHAYVQPKNGALDKGWEIDLDASASTWFESEEPSM